MVNGDTENWSIIPQSFEFKDAENRRLGCESDREILMAPACVILSLGLWNLNSAPVLGRALGVGA